MEKMWKKYKSIAAYLFFGVCTTIVNMIVYYISARKLGMSTVAGTCVAWAMAVLFAYITNRKWVFESRADGLQEILREIVSFFLCRLATGFLDMFFMFVFVDYMGLNDMVIKALSNVLVIITNYIASKLIVFKKR